MSRKHGCMVDHHPSAGIAALALARAQTWMPASGDVTRPASMPISVTFTPMTWATVRSDLAQVVAGEVAVLVAAQPPSAFPAKSTGHSRPRVHLYPTRCRT